MKTLREIYDHYDIIPCLREHQLRVAAVAKIICLNLKIPIKTEQVVQACLFHDMGNIIKFDFSHFPKLFEPLGIEYWKSVKERFVKKYGSDEHAAHITIAKEIGLDENIISTIDHIGFHKLDVTNRSGVFEYMIASYADSRVAPAGVVLLAERSREGMRRHAEKIKRQTPAERKTLVDALNKLEILIFSKATIKPEDITEQNVAPLVLDLEKYSF